MVSKVRVVVLVSLLGGCSAFQQATDALTQACQFYYTVKSIVEVAAMLHPVIATGLYAITAKVDPVCKAVIEGRPVPEGFDATWVKEQTVGLEALERMR